MSKQYLDKDGLETVRDKVNEARETAAGAIGLAQSVSEKVSDKVSYVGKELEYNIYSWSDTKESGAGVGYDFTITEDGWYCVDVTLRNTAEANNIFSIRDFDSATSETHSLFKVEYSNIGGFRTSQLMPLKAGNYRYVHAGVGTINVYMNRREMI